MKKEMAHIPAELVPPSRLNVLPRWVLFKRVTNNNDFSLKRGYLRAIRRHLDANGLIPTYQHMRRIWKNQYGYRLSETDDVPLFADVAFRRDLSGSRFTYPLSCLTMLGDGQSLPRSYRYDGRGAVELFLQDMRALLPQLLGQDFQLVGMREKPALEYVIPKLVQSSSNCSSIGVKRFKPDEPKENPPVKRPKLADKTSTLESRKPIDGNVFEDTEQFLDAIQSWEKNQITPLVKPTNNSNREHSTNMKEPLRESTSRTQATVKREIVPVNTKKGGSEELLETASKYKDSTSLEKKKGSIIEQVTNTGSTSSKTSLLCSPNVSVEPKEQISIQQLPAQAKLEPRKLVAKKFTVPRMKTSTDPPTPKVIKSLNVDGVKPSTLNETRTTTVLIKSNKPSNTFKAPIRLGLSKRSSVTPFSRPSFTREP